MTVSDCYLFRDEHVPHRACFPVIDAHNHLWGNWGSVDDLVTVLDEVGVVQYCDLTANVTIEWADGGYRLGQGSFGGFLENAARRYPGRLYGFTTATFARPVDQPLFEDASQFVDETLVLLRDHVASGARGLKILKELGLRYRDAAGVRVRIDDERLSPVWAEAGRLGVPVLMHQSDPYGFFEPITPANEHYETLLKFPSWSFADPRFPRKRELLAERDRLFARHPDTVFILPHVANFPENLEYVAQLLESNSNVLIDFSARLDELGRQPYTSREFMIRYQDRILFGTDMPVSADMYRCYFRFLETHDEYFFPPDYDGTFERRRWPICGLGLPREVLRKVYIGNVCRAVPGVREALPADVVVACSL